MDTQWPRYEVFEQERPGGTYRNAGSVHAPDSEMALENARDVFARRPQCYSLWVVPASEILARTAQELETWQPAPPPGSGLQPEQGGAGAKEPLPPDLDSPTEPYLVFQKRTQRATETYVEYVGELAAHSAEAALSLALKEWGGGEVFVWWVCPARAVTRSEESDVEPMFAPAESKPFRQPQFYKVVSQLYQIRAARSGEGRE